MATNDVILEEDNDIENNVSLHAEGGHFVTDIEPLTSNLLRNDLDYAASAALQEGIGPSGMPLVNLDGSLFEFEGYGDDVNGGYSSDEMFVPFTGNGGDAEGTSSLKEQPNKARKVHKRTRLRTKISLKGKALATFNKMKKQQYKDSRDAKRAEMKAFVQAEKPFPPRPLRELALMEKLHVGKKGAHILLSRRRESNNSSKKASNSDTSDGDGDEDSLAKKARKSSLKSSEVSFFPARAAW